MDGFHIERDDKTSWCNERLGNEFTFKTVERAALNMMHGDLPVCMGCVYTLHEILAIDDYVNKGIIKK